MAKGYARLASESIPGNELNTPTLGAKTLFPRLQTLELQPGTNPLERDDELLNTDEPVQVLPELYDPSWTLSARGYPDLLGMLLMLQLGLPVSTAGNGVITDPDAVVIPTGAFKHVWTAPFGPSGASPKTAQADVAYSDQSVFYKGKGVCIQELTVDSPDSGGMGLKASGPVLYLNRGADPAMSPAYESDALPPFLRGHLSLPTWLASTQPFRDFGVVIAAALETDHQAGSGSKWPDAVYKGDTPIVVTGSIPKQLIGAADLDALRDSTGFAVKARWTNTAIIASAYPYKLFIEGSNCQYVDGAPDPLANVRRIGATFNFKFTRAGSASATITLVNATASYA